ncbi:MAG: hypothetical protein RMJ98_16950 [Myxococcales bacterium]|nr:hypothetical protein [Polyangiaceae bacterium]MDW8250985.1 hypothetical protein [Myxococcales bacterium]
MALHFAGANASLQALMMNVMEKANFQALAHENLNHCDRARWINRAAMGDRISLPRRRPDWRDSAGSARFFSATETSL